MGEDWKGSEEDLEIIQKGIDKCIQRLYEIGEIYRDISRMSRETAAISIAAISICIIWLIMVIALKTW